MKRLISALLVSTILLTYSVPAFADTMSVKQNPNTDDNDLEVVMDKKEDESEIIPFSSRTESESNNTRGTADKMYIGDTMRGYMNNSSDIDCFLFVPTSSQTVTITLTGPSSSSYDYDLWLQNSSGTELRRSDEAGSNGKITYNVSANTNYYIVVNTSKGYSTSQSYTVKLSGSSSTASGSLGVRRCVQEQSNWCWAAAVQMIGLFETGRKTSQSDIVTYIYGSAVNKTGSMSDQVSALKRIDSSSFRNADYWSAASTKYFDQYVVSNYNKKHATSLACLTSGGKGHSYVVDNIDGNTVTLIDPYKDGTSPVRYSKSDIISNGFYSPALKAKVTSEACVVY